MRVIIASSHTILDYAVVEEAVYAATALPRFRRERISEIVSGTAGGVDTLGEKFATKHGLPIKQFPADWNKHGLLAGFIRNKAMADYAQGLIAVWDGVSSGTRHMIDIATECGLVIYVHQIKGPHLRGKGLQCHPLI